MLKKVKNQGQKTNGKWVNSRRKFMEMNFRPLYQEVRKSDFRLFPLNRINLG